MVIIGKNDVCTVHPGELYFGNAYLRVRTLLGSCVAVTVWHPELRIGGLCHYLLAESKQKKVSKQMSMSIRDYRYADNALQEMKMSMLRVDDPKMFQVGVFGGGDMFAQNKPVSIGAENIAYAHQWLLQQELKLHQVDTGGAISRSLNMSINTGEILIKHYQMDLQLKEQDSCSIAKRIKMKVE